VKRRFICSSFALPDRDDHLDLGSAEQASTISSTTPAGSSSTSCRCWPGT